MDEPQAARAEDRRWNELAIVSAIAGLATSLCCLGIILSFFLGAVGPVSVFVGMVPLFAIVAIGFLLGSFASKQRRGSFQLGAVGAVFGVVVPIAFIWCVLRQSGGVWA